MSDRDEPPRADLRFLNYMDIDNETAAELGWASVRVHHERVAAWYARRSVDSLAGQSHPGDACGTIGVQSDPARAATPAGSIASVRETT